MLSYCVLAESDVAHGDEHVRAVIQADRQVWKRDALTGGKHGFVIVVTLPRLASAEPGVTLQRFALRLCELYLSRTGLNEIFHDELILRTTLGPAPALRKWKVGVNYFSSQGDGRWWHDHRIPGGMALSMNSVGHMARNLAETAAQESDPVRPVGGHAL